jgi:predicted RND superfamily exporter protein
MNNFLFHFVKYRKFYLSFILIITSFFLFFIKDVKFSGATSKFFIKNDPAYSFYQQQVKRFGSDNSLVVSITGDNLFEYKTILKIKKLVDELQSIKGVESVDSLFNKQNMVYRNGELHTDVFIDPENIPKSKQELEQIKQDALNNPLIYRNLIADNGKKWILNIVAGSSDNSDFNLQLTKNVREVLKNNKELKTVLFGSPYINEQVIEYILHDTSFTVPFAIIVIFLIIWFNLKSFKLTLIPFTTSLLSIFIVLGFMGISGIELSILTAVVPALVILIGTTEDSYLISEFVEEKSLRNDKDLIIKAISSKLGLAIILTASTTIVGFFSIYLNQIIILQDFAIVSTVGLFANFLITIIIVPNMLYLMDIRVSRQNTINYVYILQFAKNVFLYHTKKVYLLVFIVVLFLFSFIPYIILDNNTLNYFKQDSDVRQRADYFKRYTNGIQSFYIVVKAPKKKAFKEWKYLNALTQIEEFLKKDTKFNYAISIADNLSLVNKEMHNGDDKFYYLPHDKGSIWQYYTFFHRKDIKKYVSTKYDIAKIDVWHNIFSSSEFNKQRAILENYIKTNIDSKLGLEVKITGKNVLLNKAADTISVGQASSILSTLLMVFIVISFVFRTPKAGVVILLGNFVPIVALFGVMGILSIPLNVVTAIIATVTFGIVVDDTIHLMMRYRYEHKNNTKNSAVLNSIVGEGRAILLTTISLMLGYLTLTMSDFIPVIQFALLSILVIFIAVLSDLYFVPSLLKNINIVKEKK